MPIDPITGAILGTVAKKAVESWLDGQKWECVGCHKVGGGFWGSGPLESLPTCGACPRGPYCLACNTKSCQTRLCPSGCGRPLNLELHSLTSRRR